MLNGFVRQVAISRRDEGIRRWNRWLREDLSSRPYAWLRPDFVPPSPFLVIHDPHTQSSALVWQEGIANGCELEAVPEGKGVREINGPLFGVWSFFC